MRGLFLEMHIFEEDSIQSEIVLQNRSKGGGVLAYERGGDARGLTMANGCKFWILVSLRVFWVKCHHMKPISLFWDQKILSHGMIGLL